MDMIFNNRDWYESDEDILETRDDRPRFQRECLVRSSKFVHRFTGDTLVPNTGELTYLYQDYRIQANVNSLLLQNGRLTLYKSEWAKWIV